jgi:hypothetical protein
MPSLASRTMTIMLLAFAATLQAPIAVADTKLSPRDISTIDPIYFGASLPNMLSPMRDTYSDDAKPILLGLLEHNVQACGKSGRESLQALNALTDFCLARAQYNEALKYKKKFQEILRQAADTAPNQSNDDYVGNLIEIATINLAAGRVRDALTIMEKLPEIQAKTPLGRDNLVTAAAIYLEAKERDKARALLQRLYDLSVAYASRFEPPRQPNSRLRFHFTTEWTAYLLQQSGEKGKADTLWRISSSRPPYNLMARRLANPPCEPWYIYVDGRWYCLTIDTDRMTRPGYFAELPQTMSSSKLAQVEGPIGGFSSWSDIRSQIKINQGMTVQKESVDRAIEKEFAAKNQADLKSYERTDYATARIHTMQKLTEMQRQAVRQKDKSKERK